MFIHLLSINNARIEELEPSDVLSDFVANNYYGLWLYIHWCSLIWDWGNKPCLTLSLISWSPAFHSPVCTLHLNSR